MSRLYKITVMVRGITKVEIQTIMEDLDWEEEYSEYYNGIALYEGTGSLYGGRTESSYHTSLEEKFKRINKHAKALTRWVYLDDQPYEEFGSIDIDPLEETILEAKDGK